MNKMIGGKEKMVNVIIGLILIGLGVWGITVSWWPFLELLRVVIPSLLVIIGIVAFLAGIKK